MCQDLFGFSLSVLTVASFANEPECLFFFCVNGSSPPLTLDGAEPRSRFFTCARAEALQVAAYGGRSTKLTTTATFWLQSHPRHVLFLSCRLSPKPTLLRLLSECPPWRGERRPPCERQAWPEPRRKGVGCPLSKKSTKKLSCSRERRIASFSWMSCAALASPRLAATRKAGDATRREELGPQ